MIQIRLAIPLGCELIGHAIAAEFPSVQIRHQRTPDARAIAIHADAWRAAKVHLWDFDRAVDAARLPRDLHLGGSREAVTAVARDVVVRVGRWLGITNRASRAPAFRRALARHHALYQSRAPLVIADQAHALDTWQWLLRLSPRATLWAQLAALFHDVERRFTESTERTEHRAGDYAAFKAAHARAGGAHAAAILEGCGVPGHIAARVQSLIAAHDGGASMAGNNPAELGDLEDADALSFFSLNSPGYLAYFGPALTAKKVAFSFGRLSQRGRAELSRLNLTADIAAMTRPLLDRGASRGARV